MPAMTEQSDMGTNLNEKPNRKDLVVVRPKAVMAIRRGDYTRPVSFITEAEVYRMADAAKAMRAGERNELLILTLFQGALRVTEAVK